MNDNSKNHQSAEETLANLMPETHPEKTAEEEIPTDEVAAEESPEEEATLDWQQRYEEMQNKYLYLLSDFQTYKRQVAKERLELQATAGRDILAALLPILDDFDRAARNSHLDEGIVLIYHKLQHILQSKGLQPIEVQAGTDLDPDTQEAVAEVPAPSEQLKGKIVDVLEKGYRLGDRVLRCAKVVVGK